MKILGILGGIAPESTIAYYRSIVAAYRREIDDGSYPAVVINSIDLTRMLSFVTGDRPAELVEYLLDELRRLAGAGAQIALMASNTPHLVFDELAPRSPLPLLSIVESACNEARARGFRRVGLFGSRFTMAADFYPRVFTRVGIEVIPPVPEEQALIHARYMDELVNGVFRPETRDLLHNIARTMRERSGIDALVLGGTELPLLLTGDSADGIPLLDTTAAHVKTAVAEMMRAS